MRSWSIRAAVLFTLFLSFPWTAHGESGKLYRYTTSRPDGTVAGDDLLFVSGSRVEILSKGKHDEEGRLLVFEMDGPGLAPRTMKIWELSASRRVFIGTVESLPSRKDVRVEVIPSGRPAETVAVPVFPWMMANGVPALSLAFAALEEPEGSFTVGLIRPGDGPNQPPVGFSGPIKISYAGDEERGGVPTRKYRLEGEGVSGFAWAHRDEKRLEAWETARVKLQLAGVETVDAAGWEAAKRELLGPPPARGPVEAVEVRPHPCRVPNHDQEVLCATYPVWENRETKQGRKIGLNIVILPALEKDKEKDPVFELSGGPGQAVTEDAGWIAQSPLRQKRDVVLVDQRGTGRSNPLRCSFYGEPVDFSLAAGEMFPVEEVRKCKAELEKVADLAQYTTAAFTDDLDEVRQWLGYERINLKGGSYGTDAAQVYWRRHAKSVRSVVLAGVANPKTFNPLGHAAAGQRALDLLVAECAAQPECKAAFPDPHADLKAVKERIEKGVTVTVTNTRTGERQEVRPSWGLVAEGLRGLLYGPVAGSVPLQIRKAAEGDLAPLVQVSIGRRVGSMEGLYWGRDPVTPPESAEEAARYMTNGVHVVVKRGSHGGGSECVEGLIREFVDRPLGKKLDTSCAEKVYGPVVFMRP